MKRSLRLPSTFNGLVAVLLVSSAVADTSYRLETTVVSPPNTALKAGVVSVELTVAQPVIGSAADGEDYAVYLGFWAATPTASEQIFADSFEALLIR